MNADERLERKKLVSRIDHLELSLQRISWDSDHHVYDQIQKLLNYQPTELFDPKTIRLLIKENKEKTNG